MSTSSTTTTTPANRFDSTLLAFIKTPVKLVHPRRSNRTQTMWDSAVTVGVNSSISDAFKTLIDENISSIPAVDHNSKCVGFIDVADLVWFCVNLFHTPVDTELSEFFAKSKRFREATVADVMQVADSSRMSFRPLTVSKSCSLMTAMETLARTDSSRLTVTDKKSHVKGVITASMLIGFLFVQLDKMGEARNLPVSEMTRHYNVHSVLDTELAINAFKIMNDRRVGGLAVIDKDGQLVDTISMRDLKGIGPDAELFVRLWEPITSYKAKLRKGQPHAKTIPRSVVYVKPTDTLETVIRVMEREAIHRVWVVRNDEDRRPMNVVTQVDILRLVLAY